MELTRRVRVPVWLLFLFPIGLWININTVVFVLFTITFLLYIYTTYKQNFLSSRGFSGPEPVPFIGELGKLAKNGFFQMDIDLVKEHGTVFGMHIGNIPTVMVSDPDMIKEILVKQFSKFTDHSYSVGFPKFWRNSLPQAQGDHWKFLRSTISPAFSTGRLRGATPAMQKCLDSFVMNLEKKFDEGTDFDISPLFSALTMDVICCSAFGIEVDSQTNPNDQFVANAKKAFGGNFSQAPLYILNFLFPEFKYVMENLSIDVISRPEFQFIKEATKGAIEARKAGTSEFNDALQVMLNSYKDKMKGDGEELRLDDYKTRGLTDDELLANSVTFLLAGYDTTAAALTWLTYCIAANSSVQDKLASEIDTSLGDEPVTHDNVQTLKFLDSVLSETLRLYGAATRINRQIQEDTEIGGWKLPAGISVTFSIPAVHRLPEYWPDPERFDPERFSLENKAKIHPYAYFPFGEGPRNCVGMRLAKMEIKMAAVTLLRKYRVVLSEKQQVPPKVANSFVVKPDGGMSIKLERR